MLTLLPVDVLQNLLPMVPHAAASLVSSLISAAWEGTILAGCVVLFLRLFPELSAAARSVVWLNVFLLLVVLHMLPFIVSHAAVAQVAAHAAPFELGMGWCFAVAAIWATLSILRAVQLLYSAHRLRALAQRATLLEAGADLAPLLSVRMAGLGMARTAEICVSTEVHRPSVFGFFHPRILVPPALLDRLTSSELRQVVLHEMEHLRRGDDWTNLLQKIALVLFPLNPALIWVERRLCAERELACDDSVLRSSGRKAYAICLTHLAEHSMLRRGLSLALGAWERQSELVRRVHRILRGPGTTMSSKRTLVLTGSMTVVVLGCTLGLARSPQLVAFGPRMDATSAAELMQVATFERPDFGSTTMPAHEQLLKAFMPGPASSSAVHATNPSQAQPASRPGQFAMAAVTAKKVSLKSVCRHSAAWQQRQGYVVMTEWNAGVPSQRLVLAVSDDSRPTYAAVRFANGWLIIQI